MDTLYRYGSRVHCQKGKYIFKVNRTPQYSEITHLINWIIWIFICYSLQHAGVLCWQLRRQVDPVKPPSDAQLCGIDARDGPAKSGWDASEDGEARRWSHRGLNAAKTGSWWQNTTWVNLRLNLEAVRPSTAGFRNVLVLSWLVWCNCTLNKYTLLCLLVKNFFMNCLYIIKCSSKCTSSPSSLISDINWKF